MAGDLYAEQTEQIVEGSIDVGDEFQKALKEHLRGVPYAKFEPTDLEYVMWFEGKAFGRPALPDGTPAVVANPNWLPALLAFVEGGNHEYQRYVKARVRLMDKMVDPVEAY